MTPKTIAYSRIIDLSHPIHPGIPLWAGDPAVKFETMALIEQEGYYLRRFCMGEHSGTHMNAPNSFFAQGVGIDAYPAESLVLPAVAINVRQKTVADTDYSLDCHSLQAWEQQYGKIPPGGVVLLCTGWHARWTTPTEFWNLDAEGIPHFPSFSLEVTRFLLQERAIAGIGIDTHGVDSPQDATFAVNRQVLSQQGIVLENLTNLDQLPATGTTLVIGVPKLLGGSGAPVAVLAFVP